MNLHDNRGSATSVAEPTLTRHFEEALWRFQSYFGDPLAPLDAALAARPDWTLAHAFKAIALLLSTEAQHRSAALASIEAGERHVANANSRERAHLAAARQWHDGRWTAACRTWDAILVDDPRDVLALQAAHLTDFLRGDALNLERRVARVLPAWDTEVPGYSYVLGMHAFGLEECNRYYEAEERGCAALALEPRDPWAVHAVTHVMEMQGRTDDGINWLRSRRDDWAPDNGFSYHNWWHLALFHLERLDFDAALALYDDAVYPRAADSVMQLADASALLWRLHLADVPTGKRFAVLAADWASRASVENGYYAFNDVHAVMAYVGAREPERAREVITALAEKAASTNLDVSPETPAMARLTGLPVARALIAFGESRYAEAADTLLAARDTSHVFGGSHAQRDVISLTLIESARRTGRSRLARHVLNERTVRRPSSPLAGALDKRLDGVALAA